MKVLHVISSLNPIKGGPGQAIRNVIPELKTLGVSNVVTCLDAEDATFIKESPCPVHALGEVNNAWHYHPRLMSWLINHLVNFDVVIVHGLWLYHSYAVYKALKNLQKKGERTPKMYVMPHGMLDPWFQRAKSRKLKAIRNWGYWKLIEKHVINGANGILFTCEEELRLAKEPFQPYIPKRVLNVGFGVQPPPEWFFAIEYAFYMQCPKVQGFSYLLFLGRIHEKKGLDLLLTAYLQLKNKGLNLPDLVIAGPGLDTFYGKQILKLAQNDSNIHFVGMLQGDAKWGAFYGCEAFILPSHQENFGIAVVEAMALKKPVLISNQVNIWKEIEREQGGIISTDNIEGVKQQIIQWISLTREQKAAMGNNAYFTYTKHFSIVEVAKKFVDVFTGQ